MITFDGFDISEDKDGFRYGREVRVKSGWEGAGRQGLCIGDSVILNGVSWTPVLWAGGDGDADDNIDYHKTRALEAWS